MSGRTGTGPRRLGSPPSQGAEPKQAPPATFTGLDPASGTERSRTGRPSGATGVSDCPGAAPAAGEPPCSRAASAPCWGGAPLRQGLYRGQDAARPGAGNNPADTVQGQDGVSRRLRDRHYSRTRLPSCCSRAGTRQGLGSRRAHGRSQTSTAVPHGHHPEGLKPPCLSPKAAECHSRSSGTPGRRAGCLGGTAALARGSESRAGSGRDRRPQKPDFAL